MRGFDWLKRRRLDEDDFQEEIRAHLAIATEERVADGADRDAARDASIKDFGNITLTTEAARSVWRPWWLDALRDGLTDVRYAVRVLVKSPAFSLTVIAVLALGIGLNTAVFTLLKSLALSPLAGVEGSARLGVVLERDAGRPPRRPLVSRLPVHPRPRSRLHGADGIGAGIGQRRPRQPRSARRWASWSPAITFCSWAFVRRSAARCCPRTRWRQASIPWSSSAMPCGGARLPPIPGSSAGPST